MAKSSQQLDALTLNEVALLRVDVSLLQQQLVNSEARCDHYKATVDQLTKQLEGKQLKKQTQKNKTLGRSAAASSSAAPAAAAAASSASPMDVVKQKKKPPRCSICGVLKSDKSTTHEYCRKELEKRRKVKESLVDRKRKAAALH